MKEIYLDHAATTYCYPEVAELVCKLMLEDYGNPSSMHRKGVDAEKYMKKAQSQLAKALGVQEKEIYFTSGGTESNNWALAGVASANKRSGTHIITSAIEHAAVSAPLNWLEKQGFTITRLPVDREGRISTEALEEAITDETILLSVMAVNNEIGTIEPLAEIGRILKKKNPKALFHVDAIQAFGKIPMQPKGLGIDLLSASGHKIHGPKGVGFLYIRDNVKIHPLIFGGGQQKNMRSGTDNVSGAAGMGLAAELVTKALTSNMTKMQLKRKMLTDGLKEMENVVIHGDPESGAPHIVNASFLGVRSEVLLHSLEDRGIFVSAGSACSSHKRAGSATLTAIGCSKQEMESAVRFSFCETTSEEDIRDTLKVLKELIPMLRRFTRK